MKSPAKSVKSLEAFGRLVRREQDAVIDEHSLDEARARFVDAAERTPSRRWWVAAAALMITGLVAVALQLRPTDPAPLTLQARAVEVGEWIRAEEEVPLRFSDGTRVLLRAGAHGMVADTTATGARVRLERGEAAVSVVHTPQARWRFDVGPFEVRVTGTRFDTSWDPAREVFRLVMHEGSVILRGPTIDGTRRLVGGDDLHIDMDPAPVPASARPAVSTATPAATAASSAAPPPSARATPPVARSVAPVAMPRWKELLAQGAFKEAYAAARAEGFETVIAGADAADLFQLADAARFAGKPADAKLGYLAVRRRFAGTPHAAHAAFALGRMAFPDTVWFARYLKEAPDGPFASEALGRILEAQHALDDPAARKTASRYLARYPDGPYAALAAKVAAQR